MPPAAEKKLGVFTLAVLAFYAVSGGPFGIEDTVKAGGPFYALLGFSTLLVWAVPEALVTAELSTALPESAGSVAWVQTAFGPFWGFLKGYLSWCSGALDNSLYPILFIDCLLQLVDDNEDSILENTHMRITFVTTITIILTYINYRGLDIVGNVALILCVLSMMPFIALVILGSFKVKPARWMDGPIDGFDGVDWGLLLNTFFWNINFWESAACFSGDVIDPGKTYPKGILLAVLLVGLSSFLAILVATGASESPYDEWSDGFFVHVAAEIGGPWLGYWMMFGAAITNIGLFEAEMSSDSLQLAGMADRGILPKFLGYRSQYGTPTYGILMSSFCVIVLSGYDFSNIVEMLNLLFCFGQAIEFAAFLHLRFYRMDIHRPYTIPLNFVGCCCMLFPTMVFMAIIMWFSGKEALSLCVSLTIFGVILYYALEFIKINKYADFEVNLESIESDDTSGYVTRGLSKDGVQYKALGLVDEEELTG